MSRRARRGRRRKRIAVVTGTRAEYGLLQSTLEAMRGTRGLDVRLIVAGMHLLPAFGRTERQIAADGWPIAARVRMQRGDDSPCDQAEGLGRGVAGIGRYLVAADVDVVLVLGDRIEALAGALAGVTTGRIVAHVHGGDVAPGDFDDSLRHAITKLAHVHFPATRQAARRIVRMGERAEHVHCVGAPGLDRLRALIEVAGAGNAQQAIVIQHACGRPPQVERRVAARVLRAVAAAGLRRLIIWPNSDRGHRGVVAAIREHERRSRAGEVLVHKSVPRDAFLAELIAARVLVGNSSAGIIEAPFAGTASVDVGARQEGRQPGGPSVVRVGERYEEIVAGLRAALRKRPTTGRAGVYGDGTAGARIARWLAELDIMPALICKRISY